MTGRYTFELLGRQHDRAAFSCGVDALDRYLHRQASQDMRRNLAAVFVLHDTEGERVVGYYTLSSSSLQPDSLPDDLRRKLPRYEAFPAILIGRLAVDVHYQGQAFGELLLHDAFRRSVTQAEHVAAMAVVVDAKDDRARSFYEQFDFHRLETNPYRLFIPLATVAKTMLEP